jgi:hypothetical protein
MAALLGLVAGCGRTDAPVPAGSEFNVFAVVGSSKDLKAGQLAFSRDGVDWTSVNFPEWLYSVASGRRRAVALGGVSVYWSDDLETWSQAQTPAVTTYSDVLFAGERFVILARTPQSAGVQLLESFDGINWRLDPIVSPFNQPLHFSHDATGALWVTADLGDVYAFGASRAWIKQDIPGFHEAVFAGGELLTLGDTNFGRTSDGTHWTFTSAPPAASITKTRGAVLLATDEGFIVRYFEGGGGDLIASPRGQPVSLIGHEQTVIADGQWWSPDEGKTWVPKTKGRGFIGLGARLFHLK